MADSYTLKMVLLFTVYWDSFNNTWSLHSPSDLIPTLTSTSTASDFFCFFPLTSFTSDPHINITNLVHGTNMTSPVFTYAFATSHDYMPLSSHTSNRQYSSGLHRTYCTFSPTLRLPPVFYCSFMTDVSHTNDSSGSTFQAINHINSHSYLFHT